MFEGILKKKKDDKSTAHASNALAGGGIGAMLGDIEAARRHDLTAPMHAFPVDEIKRGQISRLNDIVTRHGMPEKAMHNPAFTFGKLPITGKARLKGAGAGAVGGAALAFVLSKLLMQGDD